ncbi:unnamed protein product, partial [Brachionus calyciflorus]
NYLDPIIVLDRHLSIKFRINLRLELVEGKIVVAFPNM